MCTVTPDNVCYAGDALLSQEMLTSKLPYCLSHQMGIESREKLRSFSWDIPHYGPPGSPAPAQSLTNSSTRIELAQLRSREVYDQVIPALERPARYVRRCVSIISCSPENLAAPCALSATSASSWSFW